MQQVEVGVPRELRDRPVQRRESLCAPSLGMVDGEGAGHGDVQARQRLARRGGRRGRQLLPRLDVEAALGEEQREHHPRGGQHLDGGLDLRDEPPGRGDRAVVERTREGGGAQQADQRHRGPPVVALADQLLHGGLHRREGAAVVGTVEELGGVGEHHAGGVRPDVRRHGAEPLSGAGACASAGAPIGREGGDRGGQVPRREVVTGRRLVLAGGRPGAGRTRVQAPQRLGPLRGQPPPQRLAHETVVPQPPRLVAHQERAPLEQVVDQRSGILPPGHAGGDLRREPVEDRALLEQPPGGLRKVVDHLGHQIVAGVAARARLEEDAGDPALGAPLRLRGLLGGRVHAQRDQEPVALLLGDGELALVQVHGVGPRHAQRPGAPCREPEARPLGQLAQERHELLLGGRAEQQVHVVEHDGEVAVGPARDGLGQCPGALGRAVRARDGRRPRDLRPERGGEGARQAVPQGAGVTGAPHHRARRVAHGQGEERALAVPRRGAHAQQAPVQPGAGPRHEGVPGKARHRGAGRRHPAGRPRSMGGRCSRWAGAGDRASGSKEPPEP